MKVNQVELLGTQKVRKTQGFTSSTASIAARGSMQEISKVASTSISSLGKMQIANNAKASSIISFKGGNANQVAHLISEGALSKGGGVATVINDWIKQWGSYQPANGIPTQHNFFIPYYNGDVITDNNGSTQVFPVRENGVPYYISDADDITQVSQAKGKKTELKQILEGHMDDIDASGSAKDITYHIYEATESVPKEFLPEGNTARVFMVEVPKTAAMTKQYAKRAGGEFAYVGGELYENYAQFAKATVEGMPEIGGGFDPRNIVLHDWHPSAAAKFIQDKALAGEKMYQDVNLGYIVHNIGRGGYQGLGSSEYDIFKSLASKEEFNAVVGSDKFKELSLKKGPGVGKEWNAFWSELMPGMLDKKGVINPSMIPIKLAEDGYIKIAGVSPSYVEEITSNPEFAEGLTEHLKSLKDKGRLIGITNGLARPPRELQISPTMAKYYNESVLDGFEKKLKFADGKEIKGFQTFDPINVDVAEISKVKKANKFNFIERLVKYKDIPEENLLKGMCVEDIVTGVTKGKPVITSTLNEETLNALKSKNPPKLFVSWGRGDFQKAFDEVLDGIKKYVTMNKNDKDSLFVICGGLQPGDEGDKIKKMVKELSEMSELKGRFAYIDGWGPADAMASACDFALFPSRFEPCGLTPQETYVRGGLVIGSNTGGMKRTIIDVADDAEKATGFRTKKGFYEIDPSKLTKEELQTTTIGKKVLQAEEKAIKDIKKAHELENIKRKRHGLELQKALSDETIAKMARQQDVYQKAMREYRDSIMSDEIAFAIKRASETDQEQVSKMIKNAVTRDMDWHNNIDTNDGKPAMKRYEEFFFQDFDPAKPTAEVPKTEFISKNFIEKITKKATDSKTVQTLADTTEEVATEAIKGSTSEPVTEIAADIAQDAIKNKIPFKGIGIALGAAAIIAGGAYMVYSKTAKNAVKKEEDAAATYKPAAAPVPQTTTPAPAPAPTTIAPQTATVAPAPTIAQNTSAGAAQPAQQNNLMNNFVKNL